MKTKPKAVKKKKPVLSIEEKEKLMTILCYQIENLIQSDMLKTAKEVRTISRKLSMILK